jgi:hypothetical protein
VEGLSSSDPCGHVVAGVVTEPSLVEALLNPLSCCPAEPASTANAVGADRCFGRRCMASSREAHACSSSILFCSVGSWRDCPFAWSQLKLLKLKQKMCFSIEMRVMSRRDRRLETFRTVCCRDCSPQHRSPLPRRLNCACTHRTSVSV